MKEKDPIILENLEETQEEENSEKEKEKELIEILQKAESFKIKKKEKRSQAFAFYSSQREDEVIGAITEDKGKGKLKCFILLSSR